MIYVSYSANNESDNKFVNGFVVLARSMPKSVDEIKEIILAIRLAYEVKDVIPNYFYELEDGK